MAIRIPSGTPPIPPGQVPSIKKDGQSPRATEVRLPPQKGGGPSPRGVYEMDAHAIATRLAAYAKEIEEGDRPMAEIVEEAIRRTGITNPQAALEEANRLRQEEIEQVLDQIKQNKGLMEEAQAWQSLGELLERSMSDGQLKEFFELIDQEMKAFR